MSRFFDRLAREGKVDTDCTVIDASNVAEMYWMGEQEDWDFSDLPNLAPPFEQFFVECSAPKQYRCEGFGVTSWPTTDPSRPPKWGIEVAAAEPAAVLERASRIPNIERTPHFAAVNVALPSFRWALHVSLFAEYGRERAQMFGCFIFVTESGKASDCTSLFVKTSAFDSVAKTCIVVVPPDGTPPGDPVEFALQTGFAHCVRSALLAVSFMHCKNVELVPHDADEKLQRATVRRHGIPLVRYYTLQLEPMRKVLRSEGRSEESGLRRALHICRGHFATYTPEHPLFGRLVGTFWVPQHTRGSAKHGIVAKDYAVKGAAQ